MAYTVAAILLNDGGDAMHYHFGPVFGSEDAAGAWLVDLDGDFDSYAASVADDTSDLPELQGYWVDDYVILEVTV